MGTTLKNKPLKIKKLKCQAKGCSCRVDNYLEDVIGQANECSRGNKCYFNNLSEKQWNNLPSRDDEVDTHNHEIMALMQPKVKVNPDATEEMDIPDPLVLHIVDKKTVHIIKTKP